MIKLRKIPSVTVLLQKSDGRILLCLRNKQLKAFPNFWVFPGGKIEAKIDKNWSGREEIVKETAMREIYEEIGFLPGHNNPIIPNERTKRYYDNEVDFAERRKFMDTMIFLGRRQTPPFVNRVFDTAYYYQNGKIIDQLEALVDGEELVEAKWITPEEAIDQWNQQKIAIPPPVLQTLRNLANYPDNFDSISLVETDLPIGLQTRIFLSPESELIPFESNTIPPFHYTNLGIITSGKNCAIIDPGAKPEEKEHLRQILLSLPSTPKVIITHDHKDHHESLNLVEELFPQTEVIAHELTLARLHTTLKKTVLNDGELILGNKILQIIHSPGHTDGHITIWDKEFSVLFAGDHVVGIGSAVLSPNTGDMTEYLETTKKLMKLNLKLILPAHGPPNYSPQNFLQGYIDHRLERENKILTAINAGKHSLDTIVEVAYNDTPKEMWEFAKANIKLHIRKLVKDGKVPEGMEIN